MTERLRVSTLDNKYTIIQEEHGGMRFLRHGEPWPAADRDFTHVGMILTLAQDIETLRQPIPVLLHCPQCHYQHVDVLPGFKDCNPGRHAGPFQFAKAKGWFTCVCCNTDIMAPALTRMEDAYER